MVVLGHDGVGEGEAVVVAAAAADGVALEEAEAGCGFARVDDAGVGSFRFSDIGGGERTDSREALREIEGDTFSLQDAAGGPLDGCEHGAGGEGLSVTDMKRCGDGGVGEGEGGSDDVPAAEKAWFAGD